MGGPGARLFHHRGGRGEKNRCHGAVMSVIQVTWDDNMEVFVLSDGEQVHVRCISDDVDNIYRSLIGPTTTKLKGMKGCLWD